MKTPQAKGQAAVMDAAKEAARAAVAFREKSAKAKAALDASGMSEGHALAAAVNSLYNSGQTAGFAAKRVQSQMDEQS